MQDMFEHGAAGSAVEAKRAAARAHSRQERKSEVIPISAGSEEVAAAGEGGGSGAAAADARKSDRKRAQPNAWNAVEPYLTATVDRELDRLLHPLCAKDRSEQRLSALLGLNKVWDELKLLPGQQAAWQQYARRKLDAGCMQVRCRLPSDAC